MERSQGVEEQQTGIEHGEAVPRRNGDKGGVTDSFQHTTFGAGPTPSEAPKAAGSWHCFLVDAGDGGRVLMSLMRSCAVVEELGKLGPRFLCTARGWQRAGDGPVTAARPFPAAASHGQGMTVDRSTDGAA